MGETGQSAHEKPPSGVLDRGLLLLHLFTLERNRLFLRELSELSHLDKATTLRALKSLVHWGFLERHLDGSYSPGAMHLRLAAIFKVTSTLVTRIDRPLNTIAEQVGQSVSFFVRSDENRICLGRSRKKISHSDYVELGTSVPLLHGGSAARAILAYTGGLGADLDPPGGDEAERAAIRARGSVISRGERLRHFASISLPLFEVDDSFLGVVTIAGMSLELDDAHLLDFADLARQELERAGFGQDPFRRQG